MRSDYSGFSLGFCLSPGTPPKTWKIAKKLEKLPKNTKIKRRSPIRWVGIWVREFKIFQLVSGEGFPPSPNRENPVIGYLHKG